MGLPDSGLLEFSPELDLATLIIDRDRNLFEEFGRLLGAGAHRPKSGPKEDHTGEFAHSGLRISKFAGA
jgi:hypothetical protein